MITLAFFMVVFNACTHSSRYIVKNEGAFADDSTKLVLSDTIITLHIGDVINPLSLRTQINADSILLT